MAKALGPLTREELVARARSAVGRGTEYVLGQGGRDPRLPRPEARLDCSGFAAWVAGVDRYLPNGALPHLPGGEWFECTTLYNDARSPLGFVLEVPWVQALAGDLLVYPDAKAPSKRQGHVGVVVEVGPRGPLSVVHCSSTNWKRTGDAIRETDAEVFRAGAAVVARLAWVR